MALKAAKYGGEWWWMVFKAAKYVGEWWWMVSKPVKYGGECYQKAQNIENTLGNELKME